MPTYLHPACWPSPSAVGADCAAEEQGHAAAGRGGEAAGQHSMLSMGCWGRAACTAQAASIFRRGCAAPAGGSPRARFLTGPVECRPALYLCLCLLPCPPCQLSNGLLTLELSGSTELSDGEPSTASDGSLESSFERALSGGQAASPGPLQVGSGRTRAPHRALLWLSASFCCSGSRY